MRAALYGRSMCDKRVCVGPATVAPPFQGSKAQAPSPSFTEGTYAVSELFDLTERSLECDRDARCAATRRRAPARCLRAVAALVTRRTSGAMPTKTQSNGRPNFDRDAPIVAACKAGHEMSQSAVAQLRADGIDARVLEGGYEGWANAGLPLVAKSELDRLTPKRPSVWVTRRRPKIDRIACPWLIRRFLDPQARDSVCRSGPGGRTSRVKAAACRSISRMSSSAMLANAARSTPCSSCSAWRANLPWRGSP